MLDEAGRFRIRRIGKLQRAIHCFKTRCTVERTIKSLSKFITILDWLPKYNWQNSFFGDLSGGLTMAVFTVPQGNTLKTVFKFKVQF